MSSSLTISCVNHHSPLGVATSYRKTLGTQELAIQRGVPTLIWPISQSRISSLSKNVLKGPVFLCPGEPVTLLFEGSFSESLLMEFCAPACVEAVSENQSVLPGFAWPGNFCQILRSTDWLKAILARYFFERIVCASSQTHCTFFLEKQILNELINITFRTYESRRFPGSVEPISDHIEITKWVGFIKQNIHRNLRAGELEAFAGISMSEISRVFKKKIGTTPLAFHRSARLEEAKKLIDRGTVSVNQAAIAFGYSDAVAFRHAYKNLFGVSPGS
jgi:AraC-like DNA-binding protein